MWYDDLDLDLICDSNLIFELKRRKINKLLSDNLYDDERIEILEDFYSKYNLKQLQHLQYFVNKELKWISEDLTEEYDNVDNFDSLDIMIDNIKIINKLNVRLNGKSSK